MRHDNKTSRPSKPCPPPKKGAQAQHPDREPPIRRAGQDKRTNALVASVAIGAARTCEPTAWLCLAHARATAEGVGDLLGRRRGGEL